VNLEIWSNGSKRLVQLTLGSRPAQSGYEQNPDENGPPEP
jgi:hypothetical protein